MTATGSTTLADRLKAEFDARARLEAEREQDTKDEAARREKAIADFDALCDDLRSIWNPRIEEFARQFGDAIKIVGNVEPSRREAAISLQSHYANINLSLSVAPDPDLRNMVLEYDLLIIPRFLDYQRHSRLEMPLDAIDRDAIAAWIDDRLVSCVKVVLSLPDNEFYIKRAVVEDPVSKTRFLPDEAGATLRHFGRTYYFESEDTLREFKAAKQIQ